MRLVEVEEVFRKDDNYMDYRYYSPTHWTEICTVSKSNGKVQFRWSSGGTNEGFSYVVIANAMKQAFEKAEKRLIELGE